jgi:hypothetical protein
MLVLSLLASFVPLPCVAHESAAEVPALPQGWSLAAPVQANEFTWSNQDAVAIARDEGGGFVLVWQSRRQQAGNYGIYARRFDAAGRALTGEVEINAFHAGPQTRPTAAFDGAGRLWFAWESFGQDGDGGTVVARRFDGLLETSTSELVVHESTAGDQAEPTLACAPDGTALVAWTTPGALHGSRRVHARRLGADGAPLGASFELGGLARATLPAATAHADGSWSVAWSDHALGGLPHSIRARDVAADGSLAAADVALYSVEGRSPVEPVLCADGDGLWAAWQVADGEDYLPHAQRFEREGGVWRAAGEALVVRDALQGYTSGLDLAPLSDGRVLVAWTRFEGSRDAQLRGALIERGALGPVFALTESSAGPQRLAVGGGARRVVALPDGRAAVAWNGDAGAGDGNAAHVTLVGPAREAAKPQVLTVARFEVPERDEDEEGAKPHEPPVGSGGAVRREDFVWTKSTAGPDFGFPGIVQTPLTPPDPHAAAGPEHVVQVTNGMIAWFLRDGTFQFQQALDGFGGFWASLGAGNGFIFDPEVIFDPDSRRFMAMANERNGGQAFFLLAVSDDEDPSGTWHKYRFNVTAAATDSDIDSPNLGVDATAIYMTADFFGPDKYLTFIVEKAPTLVGAVPITKSKLHIGSQSWGIPVMDGAAPAFYMAETFETSSSSTLRLHAFTDPLGTPVDTTFDLAVPLYEQPENPPQAGTTTRPETFEARVWSCFFRNGNFYVTHHQGASRVLQRWYEIDMANWPVSGTPTLVQWGNVDPGPGLRSFFGSIGADSLGNIGLAYARSGSSEFISMARGFHEAGAPAGSITPSVIMKGSTVPDNTGRWGDYSATVADPDFDRVFWGTHEFREGNSWATWIGAFGPCTAPVAYCTAKTTSLGGTPAIGWIGEPSVGQASFQLALSNAIPNTNAIYFFGDSPAVLPFFNGIRCVGDPITRSSLVITSGSGSASLAVDFDIDDLGRTRYLQWWFRDSAQPDGTGVGLSNALEVVFCP